MTYPPKLKEEAIRLHKEDGRSAEWIAAEFSKNKPPEDRPSERTIRKWLEKQEVKQDSDALGGFSQARRHDKKVFRQSDEILSEKDMMRIEWNIAAGARMSIHDGTKCEKLDWFFGFESNKYILKELRSKCEYFVGCLQELGRFLGQHFYPLDYKGYAGLGQPHESRFKVKQGGYDYHEIEREMHRLTEKALEAYKSYRSIIRETLYI